MLRKINAVISLIIVVLFLFHAVGGAYHLFGLSSGGGRLFFVLTYLMAGLLAVHVLIGLFLTIKSIRTGKRAKVSYLRENALFWARRFSGFAMLFLIIQHICLFRLTGEEVKRLPVFGKMALFGSVLLLLTVALHLLTNIRPLLIALGIRSSRPYLRDVLLLLSVVLLFCAGAFFIYYLRWNVWWR